MNARRLAGEDLVDDLLGGLAGDGLAAVGTVRHADAREEQSQVVVDLGDGADGRAGVARGGLLVDRDGRGEALDEVDVGLVHLAEELAGVGREALDVAALALGVDRVKGQRRLARPRESGKDDQLVAGYLHGEVFEVVDARALDPNRLGHRGNLPVRLSKVRPIEIGVVDLTLEGLEVSRSTAASSKRRSPPRPAWPLPPGRSPG
jgi:hypothetical protein